MLTFWVIDTKVKIEPASTYEQDGSKWYYGRSIVPAESVEEAISLLRTALKEKFVEINAILAVVSYEHKAWESDGDELYETLESYEKSKVNNEVVTGVFASGMYLESE